MGKRKVAAYFAAIVSLCIVIFAVVASNNEVFASTKGTVTATSLNVRTDAGSSYSILTSGGSKVQLKKGTSVTISSEKNGWYYVSFTFNKKTLKGYVSKDYVQVASSASKTTSSSSTTTLFKVNARARESLRVRTSASTKASQLTIDNKKVSLTKNQKMVIRNEKMVSGVKWYYISFTYNSKTRYGWVCADYTRLTITSSVKAKVRVSSYKIRTSAGTKASYLKVSSKVVSLTKKTNVKILKESYKNNKRWYYISFTYKNKTRKGYILASDVYFTTTVKTTTTATATPAPTVKPTATPTAKPTATPTAKPTATPSASTVISDKEFEAMLKSEGFPEDYKVLLRKLHEAHPTWRFVAMNTGLDWSTVITKQTSTAGKNTVQKSTPQWISRLTTAFDYVNDLPIVKDSPNWVTASEEAVEYYMDPRNFLTESGIFQFEELSYDEKYHTKTICEAMVAGTPLDAKFTYTNDSGKKVTMSYVDAFMDAAEYSGVSPIHLIARCKQEVLTSKNGKLVFSSSASGDKAGYEGYYNFFNIGASDSATGDAVAKGLQYAMNGSSSASTNAKMFIPWDNQYKAIMGGAKFIGDGYISKGQDTIYLQKFNVSSYSTHYHQYMTNVQAAASEANSTYKGYKELGNLDLNLVFKIPVYNSGTLPSKVSTHPDSLGTYYKSSFNNYLSQLVISNTSTNSTIISSSKSGASKFYPSTLEQTFTINSVESIKFTPTLANSKASYKITVKYNTGSAKSYTAGSEYELKVGTTVFTTKVTAENGDTRTYKTTITRTK